MDGHSDPKSSEVSNISSDVYSSGGGSSALLDTAPSITPSPTPVARPRKGIPTSVYRSIGLTLVVLGLVAGAFLLIHNTEANKKQTAISAELTDANSTIKSQTLPLPSIGQALSSSNATLPNSLIINGKVSVNNSLVLSPTEKPADPVAGQIYYNQNNNQLSYYNGSNFVSLQASAASTTVVNNVTNLTDVTNDITNVTNNSGGGAPLGTLTSRTGTPGDIALFATDDTLGDSLINQNGTTVTIGGDNVLVGDNATATNVTLGSIAGSSATTIQGGLGNLNINTGNTSGSSGNVSITSGNSSTTASGNVAVDTGSGFISGTVVEDIGFEDNTDDNVGSWFGDTIIPSTAEAHSGQYSLAVTFTSDFWGIIQNQNDPAATVVAGHHYVFSAWVKADTTPTTIGGTVDWINGPSRDGEGTFNLTSITDSTTGWTEITGSATAPGDATQAYLDFTGTSTIGETHYFDDIEVTDLSSSSATSTLNLGATDAQIVNIGNENEIGSTTIDGGSGIVLNSGEGPLTETGGAVNITGTAASTIATSQGALTITSAAATTWGIGDASGGTGGDLTLEAGNATGANNGGDLDLQGGQAAGTGTSGNVNINTGDTSGLSGNITITTGNSSTTSAGNVTVDTGSNTITGLVVSDFGFEDGEDNMVPYVDIAETDTQDCTQAHSGNCSLNITGYGGGGGNYVNAQQESTPFPLTAGHQYLISMWVKAASTPALAGFNMVFWNNCGAAAMDNSSTWTNITAVCTAQLGQTDSWWTFGFGSPTTETHYFDDLTVTDLSSSTSTSILDLGSTNAQEINIGNSNELAATTIQGGNGIAIDSGNGALNMSSGQFALSGTLGSSITTGGSLTVTADDASTFNVGSGTGGTGGNFTLQAGNAEGSDTNGGNLVLEGGTANGTGTAGGVIVQPQADTTTAFQVQDASGQTLLDEDSENNVLTATDNVVVKSSSGCNYNNYVAAVMGLSPSAYWKLDDSGATAADSSGNNDTGTLSNVTTGVTPGPFSCANTHPAMSFDENDPSGITTATQSSMPNSFTQVVMFKSNGSGLLIGASDSGFNNYDRELYIGNNGDLYFRIYSNPTGNDIINSSAVVNDNNWHMAVATVSNAGMFLYVDGVLVASNPTYNTPQPYVGSWYLGDNNANFGDYTGDLAEVAVIPSALNQSQVTNLARNSGFYDYNTASVGIGTADPGANLEDAGSALFDAPLDSTTAFQIQNSAQQNLLAVDTQNNAIVVGNDGTPSAVTVRGGEGIGTNVAGSDLTVQGSDGTGGENGGDILFQTGQSAVGGIQLDTSNGVAGSGPVVSMSYTVGNQADRLLMVDASVAEVYTSDIASVTYDNIPLTKLDSAVSPGAEDGGVIAEQWYMLNPPSGTYPIVVTYNGSGLGGEVFGAMSFFDVDQSNPFGTPASQTGYNPTGTQTVSFSVPTTSTSQVVVDSFGEDNGPFGDSPCTTPNGNQTIAWNEQSYAVGCGSYQVANGGNTTVSYQIPQVDWAATGVALNPAQPGSVPLQATSGSSPDAMQTRLDITADGEVGVDNSNPQYTLDVNGRVNASTAVYAPAFDTAGNSLLAIGNVNATGISIGNTGLNNTTTINGSTDIKSAIGLNSATAFQIQSDVSTPLFTADTQNMIITVSGTNTDFGTLLLNNAHYASSQTTPPVIQAVPNNCGTNPTAQMNAGSTDSAGSFTITTGTGGTSTTCDVQITFQDPYSSTPKSIIVVGNTDAASAARQIYVSSSANVGFYTSFGVSAGGVNGTTYSFNYWVIQ